MYDRTEQDKEAIATINAYREATNTFHVIRNVLIKFDGKCLNKRLDEALKQASIENFGCKIFDNRKIPNIEIYTEKRYNAFIIYVCTSQHAHKIQSITIAEIKFDEMPEGKRIPASKLIESAKNHRESLLKKAASIETEMKEIDTYMAQIKHIQILLDKVVNNITWETKDIYNLDYHVRRA